MIRIENWYIKCMREKRVGFGRILYIYICTHWTVSRTFILRRGFYPSSSIIECHCQVFSLFTRNFPQKHTREFAFIRAFASLYFYLILFLSFSPLFSCRPFFLRSIAPKNLHIGTKPPPIIIPLASLDDTAHAFFFFFCWFPPLSIFVLSHLSFFFFHTRLAQKLHIRFLLTFGVFWFWCFVEKKIKYKEHRGTSLTVHVKTLNWIHQTVCKWKKQRGEFLPRQCVYDWQQSAPWSNVCFSIHIVYFSISLLSNFFYFFFHLSFRFYIYMYKFAVSFLFPFCWYSLSVFYIFFYFLYSFVFFI